MNRISLEGSTGSPEPKEAVEERDYFLEELNRDFSETKSTLLIFSGLYGLHGLLVGAMALRADHQLSSALIGMAPSAIGTTLQIVLAHQTKSRPFHAIAGSIILFLIYCVVFIAGLPSYAPANSSMFLGVMLVNLFRLLAVARDIWRYQKNSPRQS